jgi:hypothetical protein
MSLELGDPHGRRYPYLFTSGPTKTHHRHGSLVEFRFRRYSKLASWVGKFGDAREHDEDEE